MKGENDEERIKYISVRDKSTSRREKCSSYLAYLPALFFKFIIVTVVIFTLMAYGVQYDGYSFSLFLNGNNLASASEDIAVQKERYIDNIPIHDLSDTEKHLTKPGFKLVTSSSFTLHTSTYQSYNTVGQHQYEYQYQYQLQQQQQQQQYPTQIGGNYDNGRTAKIESSSSTTTTKFTPSPILNVPADYYVEATSSSGAQVYYIVTAATVAFTSSTSDSINTDRDDQQLQQGLRSIPISPVCSPPSGSVFPIGTTTVTCTATDRHYSSSNTGVSITKSFKIVVRDTTEPTLTFPTDNLIAKGTSKMTTAVSYSTYVSASDTVDSTVIPVCSPPSGSVFPIGTTTVTCTATDRYGNSVTGSFGITVRYPVFGGFLEPINSEGGSIFKLGSTIPVRFQLKWSDGQPALDAKVQIYSAKISDRIIGTNLEETITTMKAQEKGENQEKQEVNAATAVTSTSGNYFVYDSSNGQYVFNLGTEHLSPGTWQIKLLLDDGSTHTVNISLVN